MSTPDCRTDCKHEGKIAMLEQRDQMIMDALTELKGKTDLILMQVTKVAVLEANHSHHAEALGRAFTRIEVLENSIKTVSEETKAFMHTMQGMARMAYWVWGLMGTGLGTMLIKVMFGGH